MVYVTCSNCGATIWRDSYGVLYTDRSKKYAHYCRHPDFIPIKQRPNSVYNKEVKAKEVIKIEGKQPIKQLIRRATK